MPVHNLALEINFRTRVREEVGAGVALSAFKGEMHDWFSLRKLASTGRPFGHTVAAEQVTRRHWGSWHLGARLVNGSS
jgi:hypothetical protein